MRLYCVGLESLLKESFWPEVPCSVRELAMVWVVALARVKVAALVTVLLKA